VVVDAGRFNEHKNIINVARKEFEKAKSRGWIPRPSPKKCGSCPLAEKCEHSVTLPIEQIVYY
jgi:hypothetical protein